MSYDSYNNSNIIEFNDEQKNNVNTKACYTCAPGKKYKVCRTFPSPKTDEDCKKDCKDTYNADSYLYDNDKCYCGNTKPSCENYDYITPDNACTDKSKKECMLIPESVINDKIVPDISNQSECNTECDKIMGSDGLYCTDNNEKCICTNPSIKPNDPDISDDESNTTCSDDTRMKCPDNKTYVLQKGDNNIQDEYFEYGTLLSKEDVPYALCGCDKSVINTYNKSFKDIPKNQRPTLYKIWKQAVKNIKQTNGKLYSKFNEELKRKTMDVDGTTDLNKLKSLIALEMCRITNDKYSRVKIVESPNPSENPGGWLKYHLSNSSSSGKTLNNGTKALVILMLIHVLFRTVIPKNGNIEDSLIYALFMPQDFLKYKSDLKPIVMGGLTFIMTFFILYFYLYGTKITKETVGFFITVTILSLISSVSYNKNISKLFKGSTGLLILTFIITVVVGFIKNKEDHANVFINYFIPDSIRNIPVSGLSFSLYAIVIGALMTKFKLFRKIPSYIVLITVLIFSLSIHGITVAVKEEEYSESWNNTLWLIYLVILIGLILITFLGKKVGLTVDEYFIPFLLSTVFGVLPFVIFIIILNFSIASYSPAIELLFLVLYRFSGFLSVRNKTGNSILLSLFGKRSTDKWVMPFLPIVSHFVRVFYSVIGEDYPGYFKTSDVITGVSNTNMWLS